MRLLEIVYRFFFGRWKADKSEIQGDWEVLDRQTPEDLFDNAGIRVVNSTEELDVSKTWVFVHRNEEENEVLAWSPCDSERVMIPWTLPLEGLLLAPGSCHIIGGASLVVEYEEGGKDSAIHVCDFDENGQWWAYSSDRGSWEALDEHKEEDKSIAKGVEVEELGKLYFPDQDYSPKLKSSATCIPTIQHSLILHWYKGSLYSMTSRAWFFKLFKWQAGDEQGWREIDSHPIYSQSHGVEKLRGAEDMFWVRGGGRYLCITQVNTFDSMFSGRFMVVYDLEERKWHYHTTQGDGTQGSINALVCNRGHNNVLNSAFRAVWFQEIDLLQLPPFPPKCTT